MNLHAIRAIYHFELARTWRTVLQSIASPVITTSLYFIVFGSAIGSRMTEIDGISYGAFIVPGLIMLAILTESISNASFGIYMPKWSGTIYEVLSAPISPLEIVIGYVGAAATKSVILGLIILATARLFVPFTIAHPFVMVAFLAPQVPLAYLVARFAVARARRGDVPDWRPMFARLGRIANVLPRQRFHLEAR